MAAVVDRMREDGAMATTSVREGERAAVGWLSRRSSTRHDAPHRDVHRRDPALSDVRVGSPEPVGRA